MPTVFRDRGFRYYFFSNEGDPREPPHVHVSKDGVEAKLWLWPEIMVAYNDGFDPRALRLITAVVTNRRLEIDRAWNEHFD